MSAEEKRQEERRIKELREFQRSNPVNRRCFDCNEMMPQYVCLDFNTFVCTSCSGIHREFAHRVKGISMSKFTEAEVKNLIKFGGNEAAQKYWRAKHDPSFRPSGGTNGERTRNFIKLTYVDRKWVYESPRESKREESKSSSSKTNSGSKKTSSFNSGSDDFFSSSKPAAAPAFDAFGGSTAAAAGGFAQFGDFSSFGQDTKKAEPSFGDFGSFDTSSASSSNGGFAAFGDFQTASTSSPAAAPHPVQNNYTSGSLKIAPPPGVDFGSANAHPSPVAPPIVVPSVKPPNDFMAFSPDRAVQDPFSFDSAPAPKTVSGSKTASGSSSSPFDAFSGSAAATTVPTTNAFDAFGGSSHPTPPAASPFDAFGAPATGRKSPSFDAFGAPQTTASPSFDAFGAPSASSSFDAFGSSGATSTSRTNSGAAPIPSDPFSAFSPRTSSGSNTVAAQPAPAAAADPFAAFEDIPSVGSSPSFPPAHSEVPTQSTQGFAGHGGPFQSAVSQQPVTNDPFASVGSGAKSNSFGTQAAQQAHGFPNAMGGQYPPQHGQMYPPQMQQQQQQPNQYNMQQAQGQMFHPQMQQQQQPNQYNMQQSQGHMFQTPQQQQQSHYNMQPTPQQWPVQNQPEQQRVGSGQFAQNSGMASTGAPSPPAPAKAAGASSLNDPFASLNIGSSFGLSSSTIKSQSNSRGSSFDKHPTQPMGTPFSHGPGAAIPSHTGSFGNQAPMGGPAVGAPAHTGSFGSQAPMSGPPGSRGNSFGTNSTGGYPSGGATPPQQRSSFTYSQPNASPFPAPAQQALSMGTFGYAQPSSKQNSFTAPAATEFEAFSSAPPRANSNSQLPPAPAAANPFDMF